MNGLHHLFVWFNDPANWQGQNGVIHRVHEHLEYWAKAMAIAVAIAVPGGLLLGRSRRSGVVTLNVANIGRAIPSFAILVVGVIWFGLSDTPVLIALALLAVPPMFTFTFTGMRQVDRGVVESARGMGMTEPRLLRSVQVPLASPLILNGIRLSSTAVLATVPLAALIGAGGLGRYVVDGFAVQDYTQVGAGVVITVALVVLNELLFAALIAWATPGPRARRRRLRMPRATSS
jgi:osmoprotectant transport system permease protein